MPKYLLLAEKISKNIKQDSSNNYLENLNNLIIEIKKSHYRNGIKIFI